MLQPVVLSFNPAEIDLRRTDARSVTVPNFPYSLPFCYPHCRTLCFHCAYLSSKLFTRLDSSMFYCNKSWQRSFSHLSLHALLVFLTWLTCCSFFFSFFAPVLYRVRHMTPFKAPQPPKRTFIVQQLPAGSGVLVAVFLWKFKRKRTSDTVIGFYLVPVSMGRWGVVQDKLWQLEQNLGGGASPLDRSRLLFNDTHCLSLLQLLPNVI